MNPEVIPFAKTA
jgi:predicted ribosome quality control (RQC) complex YloA/Tae2 family protein